MEAFVATQLDAFEKGKVSRRRLLETLTLAVTACAGNARAAAADPALKLSIVNHISYTCPDFRRAADWYARLFNLDHIGATARDVALPFGKKGEKPFGVTADDIPLTHLIIRTRDAAAAPTANAAAAGPRRPGQAVISQVAYTIADFDRARIRTELRTAGIENVRDDGPYSLAFNDPYGIGVKVTGLANTAVTDI
jgi:hypothetical protein